MSQILSTTCDVCITEIENPAEGYQIGFSEPGKPAVTMHFHPDCFDRSTAIQASRIDAVRERQTREPNIAPPILVFNTGGLTCVFAL